MIAPDDCDVRYINIAPFILILPRKDEFLWNLLDGIYHAAYVLNYKLTETLKAATEQQRDRARDRIARLSVQIDYVHKKIRTIAFEDVDSVRAIIHQMKIDQNNRREGLRSAQKTAINLALRKGMPDTIVRAQFVGGRVTNINELDTNDRFVAMRINEAADVLDKMNRYLEQLIGSKLQ